MNRSILAVVLSIFALSTIGPFVRLFSMDVPLPIISFFRAFFGFALVICVVPFVDKNFLRVNTNDVRDYAIVGFLLALTITLFNSALVIAPLTDVYFLNFLHVFAAPILALIFLKEKMSIPMIGLTILGFAGIAFIDPLTGQSPTGNILALGAGLSYATMVVFMRRVDKKHGLGDVVWFLGFASLFLGLNAIPSDWGGIPFPSFVGMALMGIISTGLGYLFINYALEKLPVHTVSMVDLIVTPILATLFSVFLFHETISQNVMLGGGFIILAGVLFSYHARAMGRGLKRARRTNSSA